MPGFQYGLSRGVHRVGSANHYRHPYFAPEFQPVIVRKERHATIIQPKPRTKTW